MITDAEIREVTLGVWETVLGLPVEDAPPPDADDYVTGCVQIAGGWHGAVTVELSAGLARTVAAALFAMDPDDVLEPEIRDAVGELANVIGGNLKALLPGACTLSLPSVIQDRDYTHQAARGRLTAQLPLASAGQSLRVSVFEALLGGDEPPRR